MSVRAVQFKSEVNQDAVKLLTGVLESAKRGEITEVSIVAKQVDGSWRHTSSSSADVTEMGTVLLREALCRLGFVTS
jgi:hypothetical protein